MPEYFSAAIVGETVFVSFRHLVGYDRFGDEVWEYDATPPTPTQPHTWGDLLGMTWGGDTSNDNNGNDSGTSTSALQVDNVLVNPSSTTYDRIKEGHPEGIQTDLVLYFPREFDNDMRGARVQVRGELYEVVGDPERYTDANLPVSCSWNLVVRVRRFDG